jgi:ketosteroid isomerase-like protein
MSQENLEIVEETFARGDREDLNGALALWHADAEWIEHPRVPGAVTRRGRAEIKRYFESTTRYWGSTSREIERFVDLGDDVLALARVVAHTQRGGPEISRSFDVMFTLRDRMIVRAQWFSTRHEALEAAGLSG